MSTSITFPQPDGSTYIIPAVDDENWGQNVSNFLIAIPNGVPPRSGTFALTGNLSFGPSFGLVSKYILSETANPSAAGVLRLAKTDTISWRNNANSGDLPLAINGTDQLTFNGAILQTGVPGVSSITGTANQVIASSSTGAVTLSLPQSIDTGASVAFASLGLTSLLDLNSGASAVFLENSNVHGVSISAPTTVPSSYSFKWPAAQGVANSTFINDGSGNLTWDTPLLLSGGTTTGTVVFQKAPSLAITTLATSGTITPDATLGPTFYIAVSGAITLNGPSSGIDGQKITFRILNDASHSVSLATGSGNFRFGTDISSYTNSVSLTDYIGAIWNAADSRWDVVALIQGF